MELQTLTLNSVNSQEVDLELFLCAAGWPRVSGATCLGSLHPVPAQLGEEKDVVVFSPSSCRLRLGSPSVQSTTFHLSPVGDNLSIFF